MPLLKSLAAVAAVALLSQPGVAGDVVITGGSAADRERMHDVSQQWLSAYSDGDLDGIMALMHADAIVMPHNQPTSRGLDDIRSYFATRIGRPGVTFRDDLEEIRINGNWAYVLGEFELEVASGAADKPPYVHRGRYFVLYEKVGNDWKMLRDIDNAAPRPTP